MSVDIPSGRNFPTCAFTGTVAIASAQQVGGRDQVTVGQERHTLAFVDVALLDLAAIAAINAIYA